MERRIVVIAGLTVATVGMALAGAQPTADDLLARADAIAERVSRLRGLPIKKPVKRGVMSNEQIRARLVQRMDEHYSKEDIRGEELAYKRFGLLPQDADYKQLTVDLMTEHIAGVYDPWAGELYLADWRDEAGNAGEQGVVMAHEICHALQDQYFNLRAFMAREKRSSDEVAARQALVEGDGMAVMLEYEMADLHVSPWTGSEVLSGIEPAMRKAMTAAMQRAPLLLRQALLFPYLAGVRFVAHYRRHHPWTRVNLIYRRPPLSTEQILHPEKYEDYERPHRIALGKVPALEGFSSVHSDVIGEQGLLLLLEQHGLAADRARRAVAGWGGDRLAVYATSTGRKEGTQGGVIGVLLTSWDEEADAIEFFEALALVAASLGGGSISDDTASRFLVSGADGLMTVAERFGDRVLLVVAAPAPLVGALAQQIRHRWRVTKPR